MTDNTIGLLPHTQEPEKPFNRMVLERRVFGPERFSNQATPVIAVSPAEAHFSIFQFNQPTGPSISSFIVNVPNYSKDYTIYNNTTFDGTVQVFQSGGASVVVPGGSCYQVFCDGEGNIVRIE